MGVIRLIQLVVFALVCLGCAADFPPLEQRILLIGDMGTDGPLASEDALIVVPMDMGDQGPVPGRDQGIESVSLSDDQLQFFGVCDRSISMATGLLANDLIPARILQAIEQGDPGYRVIITQQTDHGQVISHSDGTVEFEPAGLRDTRFEYAVQTPSGTSESASVHLRQPRGHIAVVPGASDGFSDGVCSLREAIRVANDPALSNDCGQSASERHIIVFAGHGLVELGETGQDDDMAATGDLDIHTTIEIIGCGPDTTRITAEHRSRVFEVHPEGDLTLRRLRISKGQASLGGGILNRGAMTLQDISFFANRASGQDALSGDGNLGCGGGGGSAGIGGAILGTTGSSTTITSPDGRCSFDQNRAMGGQGGSSIGGASINPDGSIRRCGGDGGGPMGGTGGNVSDPDRVDGQPGRSGSGGGGGAGAVTSVVAGVGGPGGFGGGGGGGGNTIADTDAMPGVGGFGGGTGASGPFNGIGGGGGGGAGLGGAIAVIAGSLQVSGCRFSGNMARGGEAGGPQQLGRNEHRGLDGRGYGDALFSVGDLVGVSESDNIDWVRCTEIDFEPTEQCASIEL
mgnify:CR=1 FL=1